MDFSDPVTQAMVGSIIRSALMAAGAGGVFTGDQIGMLAGAGAMIVSVLWGLYQKRSSAAKQADQQHAAVSRAVGLLATNKASVTDVLAMSAAGKL